MKTIILAAFAMSFIALILGITSICLVTDKPKPANISYVSETPYTAIVGKWNNEKKTYTNYYVPNLRTFSIRSWSDNKTQVEWVDEATSNKVTVIGTLVIYFDKNPTQTNTSTRNNE